MRLGTLIVRRPGKEATQINDVRVEDMPSSAALASGAAIRIDTERGIHIVSLQGALGVSWTPNPDPGDVVVGAGGTGGGYIGLSSGEERAAAADRAHLQRLADERAALAALLPRWACHKIVRAGRVLAATPAFVEVQAAGAFGFPSRVRIAVTEEWWKRVPPLTSPLGGYLVVYEDGFMSWSPAEAFEAGYDLCAEEPARPAAEELARQAAANPCRAVGGHEWVESLVTRSVRCRFCGATKSEGGKTDG